MNVGLPNAFFDGLGELTGSLGLTSLFVPYLDSINRRMEDLTPITIEIENGVLVDNVYQSDIIMKAVADVTSTNLVLHAALVESNIPTEWETPDPQLLTNVNRTMFEGADGISIDLINNATQTVPIQFEINPEWNPENCKVIVFVQDLDTKEIFNANKEPISDNSTNTIEIQDERLTLFPNPVKDNFFIENSIGMDRVQLRNITGQLIYEKQHVESNTNFDVSDIIPGVYFVKIYSERYVTTKKIIIQ